MLELSTYGSVGVPGGQPPGSTRRKYSMSLRRPESVSFYRFIHIVFDIFRYRVFVMK